MKRAFLSGKPLRARQSPSASGPRTAGLKVVALTAFTMKGDRERLLEEGFDGYLEKPFRYQEFLASVVALLGPVR